MVKVRKNSIIMTRGDTLLLSLNIVDKLGNAYTPAEGDSIRFALKKSYEDEECLIEKEIPIDTMTLRIDSEETKEFEQPSSYYYDIQLTTVDGIVDTVIPNGRLRIREEVD